MHEIKHPEYIPVHIILILGAFFMLFPFVWMISASFKSNSEIIKSPTDKIVLLPDSIRPSFLNDESDRKRIKEQKDLDDAWQVVDNKLIKPLHDQVKKVTGLTIDEFNKEISNHNRVKKSDRDKAWFDKDKEIKIFKEQIIRFSSSTIYNYNLEMKNCVENVTGLSLEDFNKEINNHNKIKQSNRDEAWFNHEKKIQIYQKQIKRLIGLTTTEFNREINHYAQSLTGLTIDEINYKTESYEKKKPFEWWDNYKNALKAQPFYRFFLNTLFVSITVTAVSLFFASLAAYAFAFFNFPGKNVVFLMILGTMMLPQQALLIPNYIMLSKMHWINTYLALTVPWLASAYAVFFLRQFFMQLPKDLFEAAIIDGCTRFGFYWRVALPLCKPSLVTMGVFSFLSNWNAFVWPLIVTNDTNLRVIQVGLSYFSSDAGNEWGQLMAASTMTILPLVIMYFFAQKQFVESSATSGMKE